MRFIAAVTVAAVLFLTPVDGMAQGIDHLKGLTSVDPRVYVTWDDRITLKTESQFERQAETALELGLLRAGLRVDTTAPNFLNCEVVVIVSDLEKQGNSVSYAWSVAFRERLFRAGEGVWADTWSTMGVVTVGINNLDGETLGESCSEEFELAWRRANN